jgi:hypothetical protein
LDNDGNGVINANNAEQIAYRFNAGAHTLERFNVTSGGWEAVASNVDALNFVYFKQDGTPAAVPEDIQYIEIALLVRARTAEPKFTIQPRIVINRGTFSVRVVLAIIIAGVF